MLKVSKYVGMRGFFKISLTGMQMRLYIIALKYYKWKMKEIT